MDDAPAGSCSVGSADSIVVRGQWRNRGVVSLLAQAAFAGTSPLYKADRAAVTGQPHKQILEVETPTGYVIRLRSQAQVDWLGAVVMALR